jgi:hypothetical protein
MAQENEATEADLAARIRPATDEELEELPIEIPRTPLRMQDEEPISLVAEDEITPEERPQVRTIGRAVTSQSHEYHREVNTAGAGATRCRMFHARIAAEAMEHLQERINEWLDEHEEVVVKHVETVVGTMEGKTPRPNLIVVIWY